MLRPIIPTVRDVRYRSVGTDPGLASRLTRVQVSTRFHPCEVCGTGHDCSTTRPSSVSRSSWIRRASPRSTSGRAGRRAERQRGLIPGLEFLPKLKADDKRALIAFLEASEDGPVVLGTRSSICAARGRPSGLSCPRGDHWTKRRRSRKPSPRFVSFRVSERTA